MKVASEPFQSVLMVASVGTSENSGFLRWSKKVADEP